MTGYSVARLDEIEEVDDGRARFRAVRHHFGIMSFGVNSMTSVQAGDRLINEHDEAEADSGEELYLVVSGEARFELDGETVDAPVGTLVHVLPGVTRTAFARSPETTLLAIGAGAPGKPYEPTGWELFAPLMRLFESGRYEEGADRAAALLADDPPYGPLYYNTACFECRAGRTGAALAHLRRALELSPALVEFAREDEDFEPLRELPAFAELVGP